MNPKIDIVFKKLFGSEENSDILLAFINSVLQSPHPITKINLKNPYNISEYLKGKMSILDIKAEDERGRKYDIELQREEQGFFGQRALYYWGKVYTDQIESGGMYSTLNKTIVISLLDFKYFDDTRFYRKTCITDIETKQEYDQLDFLELHFVEMSKFDKDLSLLNSSLDRWVTFLNHAYEYEKNKIPAELASDSSIKKAIEKLDILYFDEKERECYENERKAEWTRSAEIQTAEERGKVEGEIKKTIDTARKMKLKNLPVELIVEITGLSIKEIEEL